VEQEDQSVRPSSVQGGIARDSRIREFFDKVAPVRERQFRENPVLAYEQSARQQAIRALLTGRSYRSVLDAGCGNGHDFTLLAAHSGNVVGVDFSEGMLRQAQARISHDFRATIVRADLTALPFRDGAFECVLCSEVLEHIPSWEKAVSEIFRILKIGGEVIITTPNRLSVYGLSFSLGRLLVASRHPYDHWRTLREVREALHGVGFAQIVERGACFLPGPICYYQPFKFVATLALPLFAYVERLTAAKHPFSLFAYLVAIRARK
jgi:ubiquinone/menaquinone biosynthesis C-methylase UbiE